MPKYRLTLEVEVNCPVDPDDPALTITPNELMDNILSPTWYSHGYSICVLGNPTKLTGNMRIYKAKLHPSSCPHCGSVSGGGER